MNTDSKKTAINIETTEYGSTQDLLDGSSTINESNEIIESQVPSKFSIKDWFTRPTASKVFICMALFTMSTLTGAVTEELFYIRACDTNRKSDGTCSQVDNQLLVSSFVQWYVVVTQVLTIIVVSQLGRLCDAIGRTKVMLLINGLSLIGSFYSFILLTQYREFKFKSLIFSLVIQFLFGNIFGLSTVCIVYVSDVTEQKNKATALALLGACLNGGQFVGTMLCNFIINMGEKLGYEKEFYMSIPFYVQCTLLLLTTIYCLFIPDSIEIKNSNPISFELPKISWDTFNPKKVLEPIYVLGCPESYIEPERRFEIKTIRFTVISLAITFVSTHLLSGIILTVLIQYCIYIFQWTSKEISEAILVVSGSAVISVLILLPFFNKYLFQEKLKLNFSAKYFDTVDFATLMIASVVTMLVSIGIVLVKSSQVMIILIGFYAFDAFIGPTCIATITKYFPQEVSSEVIVGLSLFGAIMRTVGPISLLLVYKFGLTHGVPSLPLLFEIVISFVLTVLLCFNKYLSKH